MKKRKTTVLLAAVLCLELWIGAAPENGRQKSLIPASAARTVRSDGSGRDCRGIDYCGVRGAA